MCMTGPIRSTQVRSPTAGELRSLMREKDALKECCKQFVLVGDVSKAHRRVKGPPARHVPGLCRLGPGKVWVNTVDTYGVSSAGYWWARVAAALLVRLSFPFSSSVVVKTLCTDTAHTFTKQKMKTKTEKVKSKN